MISEGYLAISGLDNVGERNMLATLEFDRNRILENGR